MSNTTFSLMSNPDLMLTLEAYYAREREIKAIMKSVPEGVTYKECGVPVSEKLLRLCELIHAINRELMKRENYHS